MIADLKPYPEYRESGLPWVGPVPDHWTLAPNRAMLRRRKVLVGKRHSDYKLLSLTKSGVIVRDISTGKGKFSADMGTSQEVRTGDLVFCLFDVPETPRTVGLSRHDGMITGAYTVFECSDALLASYLDSFYRAMDDRKLLSPLYSGLRNTIQPPRFLGTKTPMPPPDEQAAIVRFLNHTNQRIERTIRAKRKVIALLNEQKQVIIHRAVTRGLDPNVRLKPSGVPWLGEIPEGWAVTRLKFETSHIVDCLHATPRYSDDGEYPAVRTADIEPGKLRLAQIRRISAKQYIRWTSRLVPEAGDIMYSREGERFGIAALVPKDIHLCISQRMMLFRIKPSQNSAYLMWQLNCQHVYTQASCDIIGSTAPHVNVERIKNYLLALPPLPEQEKIVGHINCETANLDGIISRTEREIDLLREYRTRLIADVVTGKLDVREVAALLPDSTDDTDGMDELKLMDEECDDGREDDTATEE